MKIDTESLRIKVKTSNGTIIRGKVNLQSEFRKMDRLSDFFTEGTSPFVTLYEVTGQASDKVLIINKSHIVYVLPDEKQ